MEGSSSTTRRRAPEGSARTLLSDTGTPGEREHDSCAIAHPAIDPDRSRMRLDQALRDRKSKAHTTGALPGSRQADEWLEDPLAVGRRDAGSVIANLEADVAVLASDADAYFRSCRREFGRVLDQIREHLLDLYVVQLDRRQVLRDVEAHRVASGHWAHLARHVLDQSSDVVPRLVRDERPVLDA